jgi:CheY-like chemotaxis protein
MNGTIGVNSEPGLGSTFWFELPLPAGEAQRGAAPGRMPRLDGRRVLVVEDNTVNLMLLRRVLERAGCEVRAAGNGNEALQQIESGPPLDLILMDVQMPLMSGLEATREIRRRESGRRTPVVALTASATQEDRQRCLDSGMDDFLAKPIEMPAMARSLERWLVRD